MDSGSEATRENWRGLRRLANLLFARLRLEHEKWNYRDLKRELDLPPTKLFQELASEAGFPLQKPLLFSEERSVLKAMVAGVLGPEAISKATQLPLEAVRGFCHELGAPFGGGGWGMFSWPGRVRGEGGRSAGGHTSTVHLRRITSKGQMSYKGVLYGLGSSCAGSHCWVVEAGDRLIVHFASGCSEVLHKKTG